MGLDTVELVMAFEETFAVEIPDNAAETMITVRDVIDYVYARVKERELREAREGRPACMTQHMFYRVRKAALPVLEVPRRNFYPKARWDDLIPRPRRRAVWNRLQQALGPSRLPQLEKPPQIRRMIRAVVVGSSVAAGIGAGVATTSVLAGVFAGLLATGLSISLMARATASQAVMFAPSAETVGNIAELLARRETPTVTPSSGAWTREEVRLQVRKIVVEHLGVEDTFSDDASFVDDLGAD